MTTTLHNAMESYFSSLVQEKFIKHLALIRLSMIGGLGNIQIEGFGLFQR